MTSRFQRYIERNSLMITNLEARIRYLEGSLIGGDGRYYPLVKTLDAGLP